MPARILIVDDAIFMRNMLRNIFGESGFLIAGEASNGAEALEKYRELSPDLVTLDIVMPEKNGIEVLKEIMSFAPDARVIMVSALGQESLIIEAVEAGAKDFIIKPFKAARVIEVAQRALAGK
jgi:two-component system chemotaxis response regulator CheY